MCGLFLFKKHHLLINTFLIIAAAGAASPLSAKVTQTKHEIMWHEIRTPPEATRPVRFLPHEETMRSIFQINLAAGKVETNRWHFKRKRAQTENCQWMIKCMQSSLFGWKHQRSLLSIILTCSYPHKRVFVSAYNTSLSFLFCFVVFFAPLSYLLVSKGWTISSLCNWAGGWSCGCWLCDYMKNIQIWLKYLQKNPTKKQETHQRNVRSLHPAFDFVTPEIFHLLFIVSSHPAKAHFQVMEEIIAHYFVSIGKRKCSELSH